MPKYSPNASSSAAPAPEAAPAVFFSYKRVMVVHAVAHAGIAGANIFFAYKAVSVISDKSSTDDYKRLAACVIAINSSIAGFSTACCAASVGSILFANERGCDGNTARRNSSTSTDGLADFANTPALELAANSSAPAPAAPAPAAPVVRDPVNSYSGACAASSSGYNDLPGVPSKSDDFPSTIGRQYPSNSKSNVGRGR